MDSETFACLTVLGTCVYHLRSFEIVTPRSLICFKDRQVIHIFPSLGEFFANFVNHDNKFIIYLFIFFIFLEK